MTMLLKKAFKKKPSPHQPSSISPLTKTALRNGHAELQQQKNRMLLFQPPPLPPNNNGMFVPVTTAAAAADHHRRIVQSQMVTASASQRNGALLHQAPPIGANGCPPVSSNASLNALQLAVLLRNQQQQQALSTEFAAPPPPGFLLHLPHPHAHHSSPPAPSMLLPPVPSQSQQQQHQSPLPSPAALMGYFGTPPTDNKVMTPPDGASQLCPLLPSPTTTVAPTLPNIQQQQQNFATNHAPMFPSMARMETMLATALLSAIGNSNNNGAGLVLQQQQQLQFVEDV
uniref:Uncharacterized protein n=1 Tax=Globodera pallida TaxID=36090 RepID=A0A183CM98_GLOPA